MKRDKVVSECFDERPHKKAKAVMAIGVGDDTDPQLQAVGDLVSTFEVCTARFTTTDLI